MPLSISDCLHRAPATSGELQAATGLNQTAMSRRLRAMGDRVIRLKAGRSPRYALTRNAFGADDKLPLYAIDALGKHVVLALIRPLAHGGFFVQPDTNMPSLLLGERGNGYYDDLPWFLDDLRPQGFLGRQIARELARVSEAFPADPRHWNAEQVGLYLIRNGDDLPGNFKLGMPTQPRVRHPPIAVDPTAYPDLADGVMRGLIPGSSAGGEQPKFTAYSAERGHVIVKFSPRGDEAVARRWRDILITEHHAARTIHDRGFPAARTRLLAGEGRLFLESRRFDRSGAHGRLSLVSLQAVDAEFTGLGSHWPSVMRALERIGRVSAQQASDAVSLWCFGRLINNTDMHLGNLSLAIDDDIFRLLPVYDMCSMGFAPQGGEVLPFELQTPDIGDLGLPEQKSQAVVTMAHEFWRAVAADERLSSEFKGFLTRSREAAKKS